MKILVTSDLHIPYTSEQTLNAMLLEGREQEPEVILVLGDIGECRIDIDHFRNCLKLIRSIFKNIPILVIPGNHDLWTDGNYSSLDLYHKLLPEVTEQEGCFWLQNKNWVKDGTAIVGTMMHYDYSAIDTVGVCSKLNKNYFIANKKRIVNDGNYLVGFDDIEFAEKEGKEFRDRLLDAQNSPDVSGIVVATHTPCTEFQMTRNPHDFGWSICTPFFGNLSHEEFIFKQSKVLNIVSGHSHRGNRSTIGRNGMPTIDIRTIGSDYRVPVFEIIEPRLSSE